MDVPYWQDHRFLIFVDSFSKWVDVHLINSLSTSAITGALRETFKYVGLPIVLVLDNWT